MNPSLPLISCPCPARALPWLVLAFAAGFPLRAGGEAVPSRSATVQLRQPDTAKRLQAPAAELREGRQLQPAGQIRMSAPVSQVRSGVQDPVAMQRIRLQGMRQAMPARLAASPAALRAALPGIHALSGQHGGTFEPGGRYLIEGNGFGERTGTVTLRGNGMRAIDLQVITWTPAYIMVDVPADISGVPDLPRVELTVASPAARPLVSRAFGFHAARETVPLPGIPVDALRLDRGYMGDQTKVEYRLGGRDGTFRVLRATHDPDRMGCDDRARDLYDNRKVPLAPGFEVVSISWSHDPLRNLETSATHQTALGRYDFRWDDGNTAVFTSGVQRTYAKKTSFSFNPIVEWLPMMGEHYPQVRPGGAVCTSRYVATIHASGPRGMKPVP